MSNKSMTSIGFTLCVAMFMTGCVRSIQPILLDNQVIVDNSLVGKWVGSDTAKPQTIVVGAPDKNSLCDVVYTSTDDKGAHPIHVLARVGKIGDRLIAEVRPAPPAEGSADSSPLLLPVFSFVVIEKANDQLTLSVLDGDWTTKYITAHPQELTTVNDPNGDLLVLNTPTSALQDFLKKHLGDDGALASKTVFIREAAAGK
jgi:hypothetical protein